MGKHSFIMSRQGSAWAAVAFYSVCGLLLLLWPTLALDIANYALAIGLCAVGVVLIVRYIRMSALDAVMGVSLALGLVAILLGAVLLLDPKILVAVLPFLWGLTLLIGGFGKVQVAFDLKRIGAKRWWLSLLVAALSFVLGVLAVTKPAFIASVFTQFIGIALLAEAVLDASVELATGNTIRNYRKSHAEARE